MKARAVHSKKLAILLATLITVAWWGVASSAPFHGQTDCTDCHDFDAFDCGTYVNIKGIMCTVNGESVDFRTIPDDYFNGTDGVCDACHVKSGHHYGEDCTTCHGDHCVQFQEGGAAPDNVGHNFHLFKGPFTDNPKMASPLDCEDCHLGGGHGGGITGIVNHGRCDTCHSPDGAYDGVLATVGDGAVGAGILDNWTNGVYEADGTTLKSGKEQWCAGCHDGEVYGDPAYSRRTAPGGAIVIDNPDATFDPDGNWSTLIGHSDGYGADLRYKAEGSGSDTATWTPDVAAAGTYSVYAWWITGGSRATNAPYTINYNGGSETVRVNQKESGTAGTWNLLGTYDFAAGTSGSVVLRDGPDADGVVVGDAIKLELGDPNEIIVDNPDATFDGDWSTLIGHSDGYGADLRYKAEGSGSATGTWTPDVSDAGNYKVYAWWITGGSRATNAPYTINYDGGSETVRVNQKATTGQWNLLGTYPFVAGTSGSVVLSDGPGANGTVVGDAIKLELLDPGRIIVDNPDATVDPEGDWSTLIGHADGYGDDLRYKAEGSGSATVTWTSDIPDDGDYNLYAWWITGGSRATNAPYTIYYSGGSETIRVNQKKSGSGGKWNYLGTYSLVAGTSDVVLSDGPGANGAVVGDAIKWESSDIPIPGIYAPNVIGDDAQTYGFYVTGHDIDCLSCHDASKDHIDHEHRTYASASDNYQAGYRLAKPMVVPRPSRGDIYAYLDDFELCADCHNLDEPLGEDLTDESHTNFSKDDSPLRNGHSYHIAFGSAHFDSDWDGTWDSTESCIMCHNVHGSPTVGPMIRHGELISTYGTTDMVPGLNFYYLPPGESLVDSDAGRIDPSADFMSRFCGIKCHVAYSSYRDPYLGPKVLSYPKVGPAPNDGSTVVLTAYVLDPDASTVPSVTIDVSDIYSGSETMYDDGDTTNHGDEYAGDDIYSCKTTVLADTTPGSYDLTVTATDSDGDGINDVMLEVFDPDLIIVDNPDATVDPEGDWSTLSGHSDGYGADLRYKAGGTGSATVTWTPDIPGPGNFNVYAWWIGGGSRATNAPYTINYDGGSETVRANQKEAGTAGQWNLLGAYDFVAGTSGSVVLSDGPDADGTVVGDAIMLELQP